MRRVIAIAVLAVLFVGSPGAPAQARVFIEKAQPGTLEISAVDGFWGPELLRFKITGPQAPLRVSLRVKCLSDRGPERELHRTFSAEPPVRRRIPLLVRNPFSCVVSLRGMIEAGRRPARMGLTIAGRAAGHGWLPPGFEGR